LKQKTYLNFQGDFLGKSCDFAENPGKVKKERKTEGYN